MVKNYADFHVLFDPARAINPRPELSPARNNLGNWYNISKQEYTHIQHLINDFLLAFLFSRFFIYFYVLIYFKNRKKKNDYYFISY